MKKYAYLFILIQLFITLASCNKLKQQCEGGSSMHYEFDLPFSISPIADTIHLGDTLWVESSFDANLLNKRNDKKYSVANNSRFVMHLSISNLTQGNSASISNFDEVDSAGNYLPNPRGNSSSLVEYAYADGYCHWKRGYVISRKGLYMLSLINTLDYRSAKPHITECPYEFVNINFIINNNINKNYHLLQYSLNESYKNLSEDDYLKSGYYAVCVD